MTKLMPTDIKSEVLTVLRAAARGKGSTPGFLTSYQILSKLPEALRTRLQAEIGDAGEGNGKHYTAASAVAQACEQLHRDGHARKEYWDTSGATFKIEGQTDANASFGLCAIFQAIAEDQSKAD